MGVLGRVHMHQGRAGASDEAKRHKELGGHGSVEGGGEAPAVRDAPLLGLCVSAVMRLDAQHIECCGPAGSC